MEVIVTLRLRDGMAPGELGRSVIQQVKDALVARIAEKTAEIENEKRTIADIVRRTAQIDRAEAARMLGRVAPLFDPTIIRSTSVGVRKLAVPSEHRRG